MYGPNLNLRASLLATLFKSVHKLVLPVALLFLASPANAQDTTPPIPGSAGAITASSITSTGLTLTWTKATDNVSAQTALQYEVRRSTSNNLTSVGTAEANGTIVQAYTTNIATANVTGLTGSTTYYFNIIVKDAANNKAVYASVSATTSDNVAPVPGNTGIITTSNVDSNFATLTLNWTKATDNVTAQGSLQYQVRSSFSNNMGTVPLAEANGTIVLAYTTDINTANMTDAFGGTYFTVLVKDAAGNRAVYATTGAPGLVSMVPNSGSPGQTVEVTITGQFTHFQQGVTTVSFGSDITILSVTVDSPTVLRANIRIELTALLEGHPMQVTTGAERIFNNFDVADTTPSVPGSSGTLAASSITTTGLTLTWSKATDNVSSQSNLQYEVRRSASNNIGTVANAELNGTIIKAYAFDIATFNVTGLTASTSYYFNVIVKDESGNKAVYTMSNFTTGAPPDTVPPVPGNSGTITTSGITSTGLTLTWTKATDAVSAQPVLQYEVRRSSSSNMGNLTLAEANGTIVQAYTTDIATANLTGLTASTTYFFNVIVKDAANNKAVYTTVSATTLEAVPPVPGNSGAITTSSITSTGLTLTWVKAIDNVSAQTALQYEVRRSTSNNIGTVPNAELNGTIVQAYTTDIATANVTGLTASTTYFFNVIVKDTAGNKAVYTTANATTLEAVAPVPGSSGTITASSITSTSLTLTWTKATDNVSAQAALQYEVRRSTSNNISTVPNAELNGTIVQAYTTDIATANVTGLTGSTTYYFNVIVKDTAGNKAVYTTVSATTSDTVPPVPGGGGAISASNIAATSLTLTWTKATDVVSAQAALQYEVRRSSSSNMGNVTLAEANGTIVQAYTTDIATANVTGLTAATTYYFNVIVKDAAGNKAVYTTVSATTPDTIAPVPGNSGTISTSNITLSNLDLNWTKATDNVTAQASLQYQVLSSSSNNMGTVVAADTNGTIEQAYTADINTLNVGYSGATFYTVLVKDQAGNKAVYGTTGSPQLVSMVPNSGSPGETLEVTITGQFTHFQQGVTTVSFGPDITILSVTVDSPTVLRANIRIELTALLEGHPMEVTTGGERIFNNFNVADTTPSVPGGNGVITASNITTTGLTLNWTNATDNVSSRSVLLYEVRRSLSNNIGTVANAEENGTIIRSYTSDINTFNVTGLTTSTPYFFNVIVKDGAGNKAVYVTLSVTTAAPPDTVPPVPGAGGAISASSITSTSLTLTWTKATDNVSAPTALQYEVRRSTSNNITSPATAEANGTIVQAYTTDIATANVTGLTPSTTYYFNVIVKDAAGVKAVYVMVNATTAGTPSLLSVEPSSGSAGQTMSVMMTGQFTHFAQGATIADFGPNVTVTGVTVTSATVAVANITIGSGAAPGGRTVTLTTGAEVVTSNFTVAAKKRRGQITSN